MKGSQYFKHDYDARSDERTTKLRMKMKAQGYGIYWMIVEKLYQSGGRLDKDFVALSWSLHEEPDDIKAVVEDFDLFYDAKGKIACHRIDRDLLDRKKASVLGKEAAERRWGTHRVPNAKPMQGEKRIGEERKELPTAPLDIASLATVRMPFGEFKGVFISNLPLDRVRWLLKDWDGRTKLNGKLRSALETRLRMGGT